MFRWLAYVNANLYGAIGIGDFPERWVGPKIRKQSRHCARAHSIAPRPAGC